MSTVGFISGKVTDTAACNNLENNSTAVVSQNFSVFLNKKRRIKLSMPSERSQENVHGGVNFWNRYRYFLKESSTVVISKDFSKSFETK